MLIFIDESGFDRRNALRKYAYSWRGQPAKSHKLLARGKRLSAIAFMNVSGIVDCKLEYGSVDGDVFYDTVQKYLLPHLMPFDGVNCNSVVVMDNAAIHHVDGIASMIQGVGSLAIFLPAYSPDYNPIEEVFSKVKTLMKSYETLLEMEEMDVEDIVLAAFSAITKEDCLNWIQNCEIYN